MAKDPSSPGEAAKSLAQSILKRRKAKAVDADDHASQKAAGSADAPHELTLEPKQETELWLAVFADLEDGADRALVIEELERLGTPMALHFFEHLVHQNEDLWAGGLAAAALARKGYPLGFQALERLLTVANDGALFELALDVLVELAGIAAFPVAKELLWDLNYRVDLRLLALEAMLEVDAERATRDIHAYLDSIPDVRRFPERLFLGMSAALVQQQDAQALPHLARLADRLKADKRADPTLKRQVVAQVHGAASALEGTPEDTAAPAEDLWTLPEDENTDGGAL